MCYLHISRLPPGKPWHESQDCVTELSLELARRKSPLPKSECNIAMALKNSHYCKLCYVSTIAGQNVFWGGAQLGRVKPRGGPGGKTLKIFEIFIPEIAANASNIKN